MTRARKPYTLEDIDGGAFTWTGDDDVLARIRATVASHDALVAAMEEAFPFACASTCDAANSVHTKNCRARFAALAAARGES